ncbi:MULTISPECIES: hypothetical protein [Sulfurimonas]|uniref:hypothetical protein n=1 Tax=Sulfurimonas TaxID=202746 RepID=UPI001265381C|nr:hypothetical protein [Sulfurimonas indica]
MKIIGWLFGIVVLLVGVVYTLLFTSLGNGIIKPMIETEIQKQIHLPSKLKRFSMGMSELDILLEINPNNTIILKGTYSLFSQSFDINYDVALRELSSLEALMKKKLNDSFFTDGTVKGDMKFFTVNGKSDVAKSNTNYNIELRDFNPTSIIANIKNLDLSSLLHMLGEKKYADGAVDLKVNFKNITPHKLDGDILLLTKEGILNSSVMKKDFGITIPKTRFAMNLDAKLKGDDVDYRYLLKSNLAKISSSGKVKPEPLSVAIKYGVDVEELAVLKPITGADIRGNLRLSGKVNGSKEKMLIDGRSDIADSKTTFAAVLKDFQPKSVRANIKDLKLQKLLYMIKQPHYADALFDLDVAISNADVKNLQGTVKSRIKNGLLDSRYFTKAYKFKSPMPKTTFHATTTTTLNKDNIDTKVDIFSTLADLYVKKAHFDMKDAALKSDYKVKVHNLEKLYFVTERHLKGNFIANGELKKAKDLDFTMHSNIAGGKVDAKLHNDDFHADINKLCTLDILDMLIYPKIFKSNIDAKLDYNLSAQKGTFKGLLSNGTFTRNQALDLTKQYAHIDLYKQIFKGDVSANINKENILASLDLKSNTSSITTKDTYLNSKTKRIKSVIDINANGNPLVVKLSGSVERPKVQVDASKILKKEATKAVTKELEKHLGKDVRNLLKGLF